MENKIEFDLPSMTPQELYDELDRYVIGQDRAKRVIALAAYNHIKRVQSYYRSGERSIRKSNVMMIGPTGVGKTHIARTMARVLNVPFAVVDCTEYTEAGYYGKDVEIMIAELLFSVDLDVRACERGIVFVDEIDKISRRSGGMRVGTSRDIGGEGVQQSLLKLLEGRKVFVPLNVTQHWNKHDFVEVDSTDILFICAGTFTDIHTHVDSAAMGFLEKEKRLKRHGRRISQKELLEYGMLTELLGRIPVTVQLDSLDAHQLERILLEPPDSIYKEFSELFAMDDIQFEMTPDAVRAVAAYAIKRKMGARGLRSIMEEVLHDYLFTAPEHKGENLTVEAEDVKEKLTGFDSGMLEE